MKPLRHFVREIISAQTLIAVVLIQFCICTIASAQTITEGHMRLVINGTNYKGCDATVAQAMNLLTSDISQLFGAAPDEPSIIISSGPFNYVVVVDISTGVDGKTLLAQVVNGKGMNLLRSISDTAPDIQLYTDNKINVVSLKQTNLSKPDALKLPVAVWSAVYPIVIGTSGIIRYVFPSAPPYVNMAIMTGILVPVMIDLISPNLVSSLGGWIYPSGGECTVLKSAPSVQEGYPG